jgi:hypothetical protein
VFAPHAAQMTKAAFPLTEANAASASLDAFLPVVFAQTTTGSQIPIRLEAPGDSEWKSRELSKMLSQREAGLRIERAKNLLLNPHYALSKIAEHLGFESLTHFNLGFKHSTGYSPEAYRQFVEELTANSPEI